MRVARDMNNRELLVAGLAKQGTHHSIGRHVLEDDSVGEVDATQEVCGMKREGWAGGEEDE